MHVFLSHSSKQKPLVREIKRCLPEYLGSWIDEEKLLFGDDLFTSIEATIKTDTDYVLLFIDEHAAMSSWVMKELEWTLQAEKAAGRTILLPIVIEEQALRAIPNVEIQNRKYLRLKDFLESSVRALADAVASELFALVCRDMDRLRAPKPKTASATISEAEALIKAQAALIQKVVFLIEEHASWKAEIEHNRKERIGRKAAALVQNGMKVLLDAGSTVEEIVRVIAKRIETRSLTKITIATTSINIADMISDCCVKMGFDDDFSAVQLFVPGGRVRPNTQAIVPGMESERGQLVRLADELGHFDLGFVGVNGICMDGALTTHGNEEAANKMDIISASKECIVVGDSSKIGLVLECRFGALGESLKLIVDEDQVSQNWRLSLGERSSLVILA